MSKKGVLELSELYNRIVELCNAENINVTEMCRRANVPRGNLTDLYKGRQSGLSAKNLIKIANYFNVSAEYLTTGQKEKAPALSGEGSEFDAIFSQLSEQNKKIALAQIKALLDNQ